jgi:cytochrome b561
MIVVIEHYLNILVIILMLIPVLNKQQTKDTNILVYNIHNQVGHNVLLEIVLARLLNTDQQVVEQQEEHGKIMFIV